MSADRTVLTAAMWARVEPMLPGIAAESQRHRGGLKAVPRGGALEVPSARDRRGATFRSASATGSACSGCQVQRKMLTRCMNGPGGRIIL